MAEVKVEESKLNYENREIKKKISDVMYSMRPIMFFENLYGIFRFYLVNGELRPPNWKMKTFGLFVIIVEFTLFIMYLKFPAVISGTESIVAIMDEVPSVVVLIQYTISTITVSFLVNSANIAIVNKFSEIDVLLHVETFNDFFRKSRIETYIYLFILIISHMINCIIDLVTADEITMKSSVVLPLYFVQKLEIVLFCKYIAMVRSRLIMINNYIRKFVQDQDRKNITVFTVRDIKVGTEETYHFIGRPSETNTKVRDLAMMYGAIGKICFMINQVFNFQIFMTLVSTFTYVVITIWTSLYYYRTPENNSGELVNIAVWCFSTICTVAVMSIACERLLLVRNETKVLVNKIIMNYDLPKTMRVQAKAFMELVEAWLLRIYIYDMFSVDITLMLKFISVATTYLIVIIQISHFV